MGKPKRKYTRHVKTPPENEPQYTVTLLIGDKTYSYSAETLERALHDFPRPNKITAKGILSVTGNGKSFKRMLMPQDMRRILWPVSSVIQAKIIQGAMK